MNNLLKPLELKRKDGQIVEAILYDNSDIVEVKFLDIKKLKFEGIKAKDIKKSDIRDIIFKGKDKAFLQNNKSKIIASLSKKHLNKIISTVFTKDIEGKFSYLKKEIVSNLDTIFYAAIPILKHPELKKNMLYNTQIIHRFALPLKIGGLVFFTMVTVKERTDFNKIQIDEFSIYDLYSEPGENEKSLGSPSTASVGKPMTFRSHYQAITYSINDLTAFVNASITKIQS